MIGATIADDRSLSLPRNPGTSKLAASAVEGEELKLDETRLARAIFLQAFEDARLNPFGRGENERFTQDRERVVEVIGEAQWFLLDDDDDDSAYSFPWCCWKLGYDADHIRSRSLRLLRSEGVLMPISDRHRFAERAGKRRLRQLFQGKQKARKACASPGCSRLTKTEYCRGCSGEVSEHPRELSCVKCQTTFWSKVLGIRRPYCETCRDLCIRPGCTEPRRASRVSTCQAHDRESRIARKPTAGRIYETTTAVCKTS